MKTTLKNRLTKILMYENVRVITYARGDPEIKF